MGTTTDTTSAPPADRGRLWAALLGPPLLHLISQAVTSITTPYSCTAGGHGWTWVWLTPLLCLALDIMLGLLAWREFVRLGRAMPHDTPDRTTDDQFMAGAGVLTCAFFAIVLIGQWLPTAFINACQ